jgi:hypothetical protein
MLKNEKTVPGNFHPGYNNLVINKISQTFNKEADFLSIRDLLLSRSLYD